LRIILFEKFYEIVTKLPCMCVADDQQEQHHDCGWLQASIRVHQLINSLLEFVQEIQSANATCDAPDRADVRRNPLSNGFSGFGDGHVKILIGL